jgi:hypothetical protein
MEAGVIVFLIIVIGIVIRLMAGGLDHDRVREYIESRGGNVIDAHWAPFGPGWFGERRDRIYEVRYVDGDGNEHLAHCKTSLWSGVYFTEDQIVRRAKDPAGQMAISLEQENRQLREELERLRRNRVS